MGARRFFWSAVGVTAGLSACGGSSTSNGSDGGQAAMSTGGQSATGGRATVTTGGVPSSTGGVASTTGGQPSGTGGRPVSSGGRPASTGGRPSTGGESGSGDAAGVGAGGEVSCLEPSPAGCVVNACPPSFKCDTTVGCTSSGCECTADGWACTDDCGGGTCVSLDNPGEPATCEALVASLAMEAGPSAQTGTCTAVVRLDYTSLAVLGHTFVCGPYRGAGGEAMARARADADATFPDAQAAGHGQLLLAGDTTGSEWLFYQSPGDFGGAAAVSVRSGLTVFAGSIVWSGKGSLLLPAQWSTSELGRNCPGVMFPIRAFDLRSGTEFTTGEWNAAAAVVFGSALPSAMAKLGGVFDAVLVLYPRTVGAFDPKGAEYIMLINGGALIGD